MVFGEPEGQVSNTKVHCPAGRRCKSRLGFRGEWTFGDFRDLEEITVKWLTLSVMAYLLAGSPDQDYTRDATEFIKSWQVDIDVGSQFHNYASHYLDRPYAGVRMIDTRNDGSIEPHWFMRFSVLHFGGRCSPAIAGIQQQRILEWAKGPCALEHAHEGRIEINPIIVR